MLGGAESTRSRAACLGTDPECPFASLHTLEQGATFIHEDAEPRDLGWVLVMDPGVLHAAEGNKGHGTNRSDCSVCASLRPMPGTRSASTTKHVDPTTALAMRMLVDRYDAKRIALLNARNARRLQLASGPIGLLPDTASIRREKWKVTPVAEQIAERRVELIGGASRRELVEGFNTGAKCYVADLWNFTAHETGSMLRAHRNIERAARLDLAYLPENGGRIRLNPATTTRLMVVPRPLYAVDSGLLIDDEPVAASFLDLALLMARAPNLARRQGGVYVYLRDVHGHLEARFWASLFAALEEATGLARGTIRATVMIDSLAGALEAEEILFELSAHAAGFAFDADAYLADHIAVFHDPQGPVFPDRLSLSVDHPMLRALSYHLVDIAHRRGCHAIAGPSFLLPPSERTRMRQHYDEMLAMVERQAADGHDGTLVVHPVTVNAAMIEFNKHMALRNQINYLPDRKTRPTDLTQCPEGAITVDGLLELIRPTLLAMTLPAQGGIMHQGRLYDRSALRLALRMLWQWNRSERGSITATALPVNRDLIRFMARKEVTKLFGAADERTKRRADAALDRMLDLVESPTPPMEPTA